MKEILKQYIGEELLGDGRLVPESGNLLDCGIDSIGMMRLVSFLEERFELTVPPEDVTIEHFISIDAIDAYLRERM